MDKPQTQLKDLPVFTSDFNELITGNYLYVDKTERIYQLAHKKGYYFLSRPRRFGKSLLVSTLKELFVGNKELFSDLLIIQNTAYDFESYPVIHLDFSKMNHSTPENLEASMCRQLGKIAQNHSFPINSSSSAHECLEDIIEFCGSKNKKLVLLIDEYDDPIISHITDKELYTKNRDVLQRFYKTVKGLDKHWRFVFITGIAKFSKTSVFSGMNNLDDISLDASYADLLGYTYEEIKTYFARHLKNLAQNLSLDETALLEQLKQQYNGYRFSKKELLVYNPFSILYAFHKGELGNFWFESGTPSFLVKLLKNRQDLVQKISMTKKEYLQSTSLAAITPESLSLTTLLFQTGYFTITDYDAQRHEYEIGYPNLEVENALRAHLVLALTDHLDQQAVTSVSRKIRDAVYATDFESLVKELQVIFSSITYRQYASQKTSTTNQPNEGFYHALLHLLFTMADLKPESEVATSIGLIDMVVHAPQTIVIFEFKYNATVQKALDQIKSKNYAEKYVGQGKHIFIVGLSFSYNEKKLTLDYQQELVK